MADRDFRSRESKRLKTGRPKHPRGVGLGRAEPAALGCSARSLAVLCGFSACFVFASAPAAGAFSVAASGTARPPALTVARRTRAEAPVGLGAQGVSVSWAIHNPLGLDVRDALARPVSARLVEEQLKSAQAHAEGRASYASRLPLARAFIRFLEFLPALKLFMAGGFPAPPRGNAEAVSMSPKSGPKAAVPAWLALCAVVCAAALFFQGAWRPARPDSPSATPLRC